MRLDGFASAEDGRRHAGYFSPTIAAGPRTVPKRSEPVSTEIRPRAGSFRDGHVLDARCDICVQVKTVASKRRFVREELPMPGAQRERDKLYRRGPKIGTASLLRTNI